MAAPLQADVPVGDHEAGEWRSDVASSHRARLPLLDSAAPAVDGVVRTAAARPGAPGDDAGEVRDRAGRALADLRAAPLSRPARRLRAVAGQGTTRSCTPPRRCARSTATACFA